MHHVQCPIPALGSHGYLENSPADYCFIVFLMVHRWPVQGCRISRWPKLTLAGTTSRHLPVAWFMMDSFCGGAHVALTLSISSRTVSNDLGAWIFSLERNTTSSASRWSPCRSWWAEGSCWAGRRPRSECLPPCFPEDPGRAVPLWCNVPAAANHKNSVRHRLWDERIFLKLALVSHLNIKATWGSVFPEAPSNTGQFKSGLTGWGGDADQLRASTQRVQHRHFCPDSTTASSEESVQPAQLHIPELLNELCVLMEESDTSFFFKSLPGVQTHGRGAGWPCGSLLSPDLYTGGSL